MAMDVITTLARALLESASDAIVATDRDGAITFWNAGAERIFGYAGSEAVGRSLAFIIPERLRARHWAGYGDVMRTGESRYGHGDLLSVPSLRKDGTPISVEFTIVPLKDEHGRMAGMAAVMRDVTARFQELRDLRRELAAKSDSKSDSAA
jgi:PAS domain S-box-containing protein